jgi:drug/metabolite transporter (DMT)-like permease
MTTPWQAPSKLTQNPLWPRALGAMAVLLFAMTIPMTRLANGSLEHPQWPPLFVAAARAALAGALALAHLLWVRAARPQRAHAPWLAAIMLGGVLAFPLCMGWAVRIVPASHAAVLTGLLPLSTAVLAAWWMGQRPRLGFWLASLAGAALIMAFVWTSAPQQAVPVAQALQADACLLLAIVGASVAYVAGARLSREMPSAQVMSWALVLAWPLTASLAWHWWPDGVQGLGQAWARMAPGAWWALAYLAVCSTWLGFFLWYAALARDPMRVSQMQLLQPFAAIALAGGLLGEQVPPQTWAFAAAVLCTVLVGQRLARAAPATVAPAAMRQGRVGRWALRHRHANSGSSHPQQPASNSGPGRDALAAPRTAQHLAP